jgi:hypothetical protein
MADQVMLSQRRTMLVAIAASFVVTVALWFLLLRFLPAPATTDPLSTALACAAIAALLTLVMGVESIAHERLVTPAIDPLAGFETRRMRVNARYLSNTVEQFIVFAVGLLALSHYGPARLLVIVSIVWIVARWAFWIGYHFSPLLRGLGAPGMLQSMIVLLYVAWRWGNEAYGAAAGIVLIVIFVAIEAFLFWATKRPSQ